MKNADLFVDSIDIFLSIHPKYANKILEGVKTIELRRRFPVLNGFPARLLIYATTPEQSIIGYTEIHAVHYLSVEELWRKFSECSHIEKHDFDVYFSGVMRGYGVELKNPVRFNNPISIKYLKQTYGMVAPQSYRYLNEEHEALFTHGI